MSTQQRCTQTRTACSWNFKKVSGVNKTFNPKWRDSHAHSTRWRFRNCLTSEIHVIIKGDIMKQTPAHCRLLALALNLTIPFVKKMKKINQLLVFVVNNQDCAHYSPSLSTTTLLTKATWLTCSGFNIIPHVFLYACTMGFEFWLMLHTSQQSHCTLLTTGVYKHKRMSTNLQSLPPSSPTLWCTHMCISPFLNRICWVLPYIH